MSITTKENYQYSNYLKFFTRKLIFNNSESTAPSVDYVASKIPEKLIEWKKNGVPSWKTKVDNVTIYY